MVGKGLRSLLLRKAWLMLFVVGFFFFLAELGLHFGAGFL